MDELKNLAVICIGIICMFIFSVTVDIRRNLDRIATSLEKIELQNRQP